MSEQILQLRKRIGEYYDEIKSLEQQIQRLVDQLYVSCQHNWIYDPSLENEHIEYICTKCNLNKRKCT